ncbi:N-acetyl-gamma-glutamyl-phosphate reductase [Streptomyces sp. NBC_00525]|uniref:N-acetyl-gamma-glutamyl-phosphate reductase n=1 Tax=Streptomyces sp. NBC_00525 TaxID=2903660 RepID=UPI002E81D2A4|nr:N-acetyl-gamma-glutamyl-phosphate reductase [Streptomyces sp. NBC_00525]WUC97894.1 N-acetyl-gamma-glutamyl-phosphate reductase [Streptomyces sp. NBC_00525]
MKRIAVVGGRGFVGGELLRLLVHHPGVEVAAVTSETHAGRAVENAHPPLRGSGLRYSGRADLAPVDLVFLAGVHGSTAEILDDMAALAPKIVDLTADFRIEDAALMERYYGWSRRGARAKAFVRGLPELHREQIAGADRVAVPGCMATSAILSLAPLAVRGLLKDVQVDARTGSSGAGASGGAGNSHALRSGVMRVFAPFDHRHEAEVSEALGVDASMTVTATPQVRGVQTLTRVAVGEVTERELLTMYREDYGAEPFVRLVNSPRGTYRYPDPKVLLGSNYCDVGVVADRRGRALVMGSLDNLMKGAAGGAVQCMNLMLGLPETSGLTFPGLHPV